MTHPHSPASEWRILASLAVVVTAVVMGLAGPADAGFRFKRVVNNFTAIPGGGGSTFWPTQPPGTDGEWVEFTDLSGGIWRATLNGKKLKRLIANDTKIPGGWGTFQQGGSVSSYAQLFGGTLVVVADLCNGGCGPGVGIFTRSVSGGPIAKLVDRNDTNDAFAGDDKHFGGFGADFRIGGDGVVVFQNRQQVFSVPIGGGPVTAVAGPQDLGHDPPGPYCCLSDNPSISGKTVFLRGGNVNGRSALFTVNKSGDPQSFEYVATNATRPPHTPDGYHFNDFEWFNPVIDQTLVFGGASLLGGDPATYISGIYSQGDKFRRLVDSNMDVPGGTGKFKFAHGYAKPIVASNGIVVFGLWDANDKVGLYAVRQTGGKIKKIIAQGDQIDGFTVGILDIGRAALSGSTLVFFAGCANNACAGIYTTQVDLP
jgi:hypothetical protein